MFVQSFEPSEVAVFFFSDHTVILIFRGPAPRVGGLVLETLRWIPRQVGAGDVSLEPDLSGDHPSIVTRVLRVVWINNNTRSRVNGCLASDISILTCRCCAA